MQLNSQELATTLAALRHFQLTVKHTTRKEHLHFDDVSPLNDEEIDQLCDKINQAELESIYHQGD